MRACLATLSSLNRPVTIHQLVGVVNGCAELPADANRCRRLRSDPIRVCIVDRRFCLSLVAAAWPPCALLFERIFLLLQDIAHRDPKQSQPLEHARVAWTNLLTEPVTLALADTRLACPVRTRGETKFPFHSEPYRVFPRALASKIELHRQYMYIYVLGTRW